jgi:L-lactate dehydrogenase
MINVTIIGFGNVGSSLLLLLLNNGHAMRLNVMEPNDQREGAFLDFAHSMSLYLNKELIVNNEDLFNNSDFIFYTAGTPNVHGVSRLSIAEQNIQLTKELFEGREFNKTPYVVAITNPVDIVSHALYQFSELPADHVIGTGTFLDSVRLAYYLSTLSDHEANDFDPYVLGEHGESQFAAYSLTKVKDTSILSCDDFDAEALIIAEKLTRNAAFQIRETQKGTTYAVSKCAEVIMNSLLDKEAHYFPLSMLTNKYFNSLLQLDHSIYISMPAEISAQGIKIVNDIQLTEAELKSYHKSAEILAAITE